MTCPQCGQENPAGSRFCRGCGANLVVEVVETPSPRWSCATCGRDNAGQTRFCAGCGHPRAATTEAVGTQAPVSDGASLTCPSCAAVCAGGTRFCKACGTVLTPPDIAGKVPAAPPAEPEEPPVASTDGKAPDGLPIVPSPAGEATPPAPPAASKLASEPSPERASAREPAPSFGVRPSLETRSSPGSKPQPEKRASPASERERSSRIPGIAIAAVVIVLVAGIGGIVAYKFLHTSTGAAPGAPATSGTVAGPAAATSNSAPAAKPETAQAATPPPPARTAVSPVAAAPSGVATASSSMPAMVATPTRSAPSEAPSPSAGVAAGAGNGATPAAPTQAPVVVATPSRPAVEPRRVRPPHAAAKPDIALSLVRKGESAFQRQDYSTAIANAKAALEVKPGYGRAARLLHEAQQAQEKAMNSISIQ